MGYMKIENLYRSPDFLECFCLEKIHGTSSHLKFSGKQIHFFSGGESHENFKALFDENNLLSVFRSNFDPHFCPTKELVIFGEAFGGKQQGMSETYGQNLRFMAFDVRIDDTWLDVPSAEAVTRSFGLEFVPYRRGPLALEWLNEQRDMDSEVAVCPGKKREGVVIRPIREMFRKDGSRIIFKHKRDEFMETKTPRKVDPAEALLFTEAQEIASEYVTLMRLEHVLQKTEFRDERDFGKVIRAMQDDIKIEASGEIAWTKQAASAIGRETAMLLKKRLENRLESATKHQES